MKITFASIPAYGHIYPWMPLALAARDAGHDVRIATGDPFLDALPLPTDNCFPRGMSLHDVEQEVFASGFDHDDPLGFPLTLFGHVAAAHARTGLRAIWTQAPPDLVVHENLNLGASQAAAEFGVPALAFSIGMGSGLTKLLYDSVQVPVPPIIDPVPPGWEPPPEGVTRIPIRTVGWSMSTAPVPVWMRKPGDPIAYLTLGTVSFGAVEVLRRSVVETAERGFRVLVAVGAEGDPARLGDLPGSVQVERFVNQPTVLSLVDVAVHHGGTGTLLGCLAAGVPQVLTPQGADQFVNAARLVELGLGTVVPNDSPGGTLGAAVSRVVADEAVGASVRETVREIASMPSPEQVVAQLVSFV